MDALQKLQAQFDQLVEIAAQKNARIAELEENYKTTYSALEAVCKIVNEQQAENQRLREELKNYRDGR